MGEAKSRGSKGERFQQALEKFKPVSTKDLRQKLGLSENSSFLGYVIHLPESDEFLADFQDDDFLTLKKWAAIPDLALRYDDFHEAVKVLKAISTSTRETVLSVLWENDTHYFITTPD